MTVNEPLGFNVLHPACGMSGNGVAVGVFVDVAVLVGSLSRGIRMIGGHSGNGKIICHTEVAEAVGVGNCFCI